MTQAELEEVDRITGSDDELWHYYPRRLVSGVPPRVGDRALCGYVKESPTTYESAGCPPVSQLPLCVVCAEIYRDWRSV